MEWRCPLRSAEGSRPRFPTSAKPTRADADADALPPPRDGIDLLFGSYLKDSGSETTTCGRRPSALWAKLLERPNGGLPDAWYLVGCFQGDRRSAQAWRSSGAVVLDLDYEDPELPKEKGAHQALPPSERNRILAAPGDYEVPGVTYSTSCRLRVIHVLEEDVVLAKLLRELVEGAAGC